MCPNGGYDGNNKGNQQRFDFGHNRKISHIDMANQNGILLNGTLLHNRNPIFDVLYKHQQQKISTPLPLLPPPPVGEYQNSTHPHQFNRALRVDNIQTYTYVKVSINIVILHL